MPLQRRVPKFGFKNPNRVEYKGINLDTLQELIQKGVRLILTREWMSPQEAISPNRSDAAAAA